MINVILSYFEDEKYYRIHHSGTKDPNISKYGKGPYKHLWTHEVPNALVANRLKNHTIKQFGKRVGPNSMNFWLTGNEPSIEDALKNFDTPADEKTNIILYYYKDEDFYRTTFSIKPASDDSTKVKVWARTTSDRNEAEAFSRFINANWGEKYLVEYNKYGSFSSGFKTDNTDIAQMKAFFEAERFNTKAPTPEFEVYEAF